MNKAWKWLLPLVAAILLIMGVSVAIAANNSKEDLPEENTEQVQEVAEIDEEDWKQLTAIFDIPADADWIDIIKEIHQNPVWSDHSSPTQKAERRRRCGFDDAVSFPLSMATNENGVFDLKKAQALVQEIKDSYDKESNTNAVLDSINREIEWEIATNPTVGYEVATEFNTREIPGAPKDGAQTFGQLPDNVTWLPGLIETCEKDGLDQFKTYHTYYWREYGVELPLTVEEVPQWREDHPNLPKATEEQRKAIRDDNGNLVEFVTDEWLDYANKLILIQRGYTQLGVNTNYNTSIHTYLNAGHTSWNFCLPVWNSDKNYRDKLPGVEYGVQRKDGSFIMKFAYNTADLRIMHPENNPPAKKTDDGQPNKTPQEDDGQPDKPSDDDGTPDKDDDDDDDGKPDKTPKKDSGENPAKTGDGDTSGGSDRQDDTTEDENRDKDREGQDNQGHQDAEDTTPGKTEQDDEHKDQENQQEDEDQMDYGNEFDEADDAEWTAVQSNGQSSDGGAVSQPAQQSNNQQNNQQQQPAQQQQQSVTDSEGNCVEFGEP